MTANKDYESCIRYFFGTGKNQGGITNLKTRHLVKEILRCLFFGKPMSEATWDWLDHHGYISHIEDDTEGQFNINFNNAQLEILLLSDVFEGKLDHVLREDGQWCYKITRKGDDYIEQCLLGGDTKE